MHQFNILLSTLLLLSESLVIHVPTRPLHKQRSTSVTTEISDTFNKDWENNETWSQKQMRTLWERGYSHKIVTTHVRRMIHNQESKLMVVGMTHDTSTLQRNVVNTTSFESESIFQIFYNGRFPRSLDCQSATKHSNEKRKKISYRLDFAYDGTQFVGWQRQKDVKQLSVQKCVEDYLAQVTGEENVDVRVAGRTDAGVHAIGQVGRVRLKRPLMQRNIFCNSWCIWSISETSSKFHPSFGSKNRSYVYMIDTLAFKEVLLQNSSYDDDDEKDLYSCRMEQDAMIHVVKRINDLLGPLVGKPMDYLAFSYGRVKTETTICNLSHACARLLHYKSAHESLDHPESKYALAIELTGNRFLRRMVRILVATTLQMALFPDSHTQGLVEILQSRDRSQSASPAPAAGLVFIGADCEDEVHSTL